MRRKQRRWNASKNHGGEENRKRYMEEVKATQKAIRDGRRSQEERVARAAKKNPKMLWSYIKGKTVNRASVGPIMEGNKVLMDDREQAEALNNFFSSVFSREVDDGPKLQGKIHLKGGDFSTVEFTEEKVAAKIDKQ